RWIALVGFLQIGVSYACVFTAEQWIDSGLTALIFASFAIWVPLFGHFLLADEPLTGRILLAIFAGLAGVAVIQGPALARTGAVTGPLAAGGLLVLTSAVVSAFSAVIVKKRLSGVSAVANVWGQSLVAAPLLLAASALFESSAASRWTAGSPASAPFRFSTRSWRSCGGARSATSA